MEASCPAMVKVLEIKRVYVKKTVSPGTEKNLRINLNYFGPNRWIRIQAFVFQEA